MKHNNNNIYLIGLLILFISSCVEVEPEEKTIYEDLYINTLHSGTSETLTDVKFIDEKDGMVTGIYGTFFTTEDGGNEWDETIPFEATEDSTAMFYGLDRRSKNEAWVFGRYAKDKSRRAKTVGTLLMKTNNGGETWENKWFGTETTSIYTLDFYDDNLGFLTTSDAVVYKTTDGGNSWKNVLAFEDRQYIRDITFINKEKIVMVGLLGLVYVSTDSGETWKKEPNAPKDRAYRKIDFKNESMGYLVGGGGNLPNADKAFVYKVTINKEGTFNYNNITDPYYAVYYFNDMHISKESDKVWTCGHLGQVFLSKDNGNTWSDELTKSQRVESLNAMDFPTEKTGYFVGRNGIMLKLSNH